MTAHMMDETLDAGPVVVQKAVPVGPRDTTTDLFHKTLDLIEPILLESLAAIAGGQTEFTPQDRSRASFFHKRSDEDSRIDWTWSADELDRLVRALSDPYPSAYCYYKGERLRITAPGSPPRSTAAPRPDLLSRGGRGGHRGRGERAQR